MFAFFVLASLTNAQPVSADPGQYSYSLVVGRIVRGQNEEGECAGDDSDSDFGCWHSVNRAVLKVHRHLGGQETSRKLNMTYVSHARIRDDLTMVYVLKKRPAEERYVLESLYAEKRGGRTCLTQDQIDELAKVGINTAKPMRLCPIDED
jgi:hypothetical protein